jgi:hypothetical protein
MRTMKPNPVRTTWRLAVLGAVASVLSSPAPAAASSYWSGFKKFWGEYLADSNGVVTTALVVGAISLFIITRGKWVKK